MLWCKIALYIIDTHGVQNMFKKCFDVKICLKNVWCKNCIIYERCK